MIEREYRERDDRGRDYRDIIDEESKKKDNRDMIEKEKIKR